MLGEAGAAILSGWDAQDEVPFGVEELFFSRTDKAGIIECGNAVFQRISQYSWDELIGKPHKIVRHPDMPRSAFWLLWEMLKSGRPVGAYVKNRARDGRPYWVFAVALPVPGGYLSVRLKPTSDLFRAVQGEYAALSRREAAERLTPEASAAALLARLAELGFPDYADFMAKALATELEARAAQLGRTPDARQAVFRELVGPAAGVLERSQAIARLYRRNQHVSMNFRVLAAQAGREGAALSVVSSNYSQILDEAQQNVEAFLAAAERMRAAVTQGLFLASAASLLNETAAIFRSEAGAAAGGHDFLAESRAAEVAFSQGAAQGLSELIASARIFQQRCAEMNRLTAALEVTRIMGKVECAHHAAFRDGPLAQLLDDLDKFQQDIGTGLRTIDHATAGIASSAQRLIARA